MAYNDVFPWLSFTWIDFSWTWTDAASTLSQRLRRWPSVDTASLGRHGLITHGGIWWLMDHCPLRDKTCHWNVHLVGTRLIDAAKQLPYPRSAWKLQTKCNQEITLLFIVNNKTGPGVKVLNPFTTIHDGNFRRHSSMIVTIKWHKFSSNIYYIYVFFVIWSWKLR